MTTIDGTSYAISNDGTHIAFTASGTGFPVILVDGAMCYRASGPMKPLASLLSEHFTVYTYDRRGRGESSDTQPYAIEREIEDLEALIEVAGGSVFVYGISSGAVLALRSAGALVGKIRKLALYEPPFTFGEDARHASESYTKQLLDFLEADRRGDAIELFMRTVGLPPQAIAGMRHTPMWPAWEALAPTLAYDNAILIDGLARLDESSKVQVPALVLDGGKSLAFMEEAADAVAKMIPSALRRTLEGQTHDVAPDVLAPVLSEFFIGAL